MSIDGLQEKLQGLCDEFDDAENKDEARGILEEIESVASDTAEAITCAINALEEIRESAVSAMVDCDDALVEDVAGDVVENVNDREQGLREMKDDVLRTVDDYQSDLDNWEEGE